MKAQTPEACLVAMPVDAISIGPRVRRDLGDVESLAQSMDENGQIQPIVVSPDGRLVCGERRLTAAKLLGWKTILAKVEDYADELAVEVQENSMRQQMTPEEVGVFVRDHWEDPAINGEGARRDILGKLLGCSGVHAERCKKIVVAAESPENKDLTALANEKGAKKAEQILKRREQAVGAIEVLALECCTVGENTPADFGFDFQLAVSTPRYKDCSPADHARYVEQHLLPRGVWLAGFQAQQVAEHWGPWKGLHAHGWVVCAGRDGTSKTFLRYGKEADAYGGDLTFIGHDLVDAMTQCVNTFTNAGDVVAHLDMEDVTVASACVGRKFFGCDGDYEVLNKVREVTGS